MRDRHSMSVVDSLMSWEWPAGAMSLPVSSYEDLLSRVRDLTLETRRLQRQLTEEPTTRDLNHNERLTSWDTRNGEATAPGTARNSWPATPPRSLPLFPPGTAGARVAAREAARSAGHASVGAACSSDTASYYLRPWMAMTCHHGKEAKTRQNEGLLLHEELCKSEEDEVDLPLPPLPRGLPGLRRRGNRGLLFVLQAERCARQRPAKRDKWQHNGGTDDGSTTDVKARRSKLISPSRKEDEMSEDKEEDEKTELTKAESDGGKGRMTNSATQTLGLPEGAGGSDNEEGQRSLSSLYHGAWPVERTLWHSGPSSLGGTEVGSVMSFTSSLGSPNLPDTSAPVAARRTYSQQQLGPKVEMVYGLLSMLGTHNKEEMSRTLLAMSSSPDSCIAMRQSGCLPLLVQLLHGDEAPSTRGRAARALHNLVHSHPDDKRGRREARVLRLLEQVRDYCDTLLEPDMAQSGPQAEEEDPRGHPGPTVAALMKLSFDEEHRHAMCQLGGLHAVAQLIQADHEAHGSETADQYCVTLRRYAGMALTNLTFGDGTNKALLCSFRGFMRALVAQLSSPSEDLRQVTASVLRNLSWRADAASKQTLREVGAVTGLMQAAMEAKKESTLKSILSALWNLSAHCSMNKADICAVEGALAFLVSMLSYKSPSQTLAIIENAGGILRNISSHVAVREDYRSVLRLHNCLQVLLQQLKSPSLTVVSNACGTLWNLSARCSEDQRTLWDIGAVGMLKSLVNSKHKMISMGSSAALKNLLSARPAGSVGIEVRNTQGMPVLSVRKQRALEQELDQNLAETCDNIEPSSPKTSPSHRDDKYVFAATERQFERRQRLYQSLNGNYQRRVTRSDSRESVTSTHSDSVYERMRQQRTNRSLDLSLSDSDQASGEVPKVKDAFTSPDPVSVKEQTCIDDKEKSPEMKSEPFTSTPYTTKFQNFFPDSERVYGAYAETDLDNPDQPTNFSLRYAEGEEEEEFVVKSAYYRGTCVHDDSVKTYCTEGTPYQTPLNFSTATSMSDLRETSVSKSAEPSRDKEETKTEVSSGVMSPEKPTQYCVEGTPVVFSRVSSLSSLHSTEAEVVPPTTPPKPLPVETPPVEPVEVKVEKAVTFGAEETPLMFSRCSSLGSLSSFEQHSIHDDRSSIVSDFSRITSGMISPSELPDSPTQTEPPSPRQTKAPGEFRPSAAPRVSPPQPAPRSRETSGEQAEKQDTEREKRDELATVSEEEENDEDDDILDACINSGMQNSAQRLRVAAPRRFTRQKPSAIPSRIPRRLNTPPRASWNEASEDSVQTFCTEDTPANISHAGSNSDLSVLSHRESADGVRTSSTREESDDSSFSGDNEYILAECIQSGMPKAKERHLHPPDGAVKKKITPRKTGHLCSSGHSHAPTPRTSYHPKALLNRVQPTLEKTRPQAAKDEVKTFATEGTPVAISNATSLSDLTVDSPRVPLTPRQPSDGQCYSPIRYATEDTPAQFSHASSLSSLQIEDEVESRREVPSDSWEDRRHKTASSASEEVITVLSRTGSLSSLSVESLGAEPSPSEQALLEQCISLGMPKSKSDLGCGKRRLKKPRAEPSERSRSLEKRGEVYRLPVRSESHEDQRTKNEAASAVADQNIPESPVSENSQVLPRPFKMDHSPILSPGDEELSQDSRRDNVKLESPEEGKCSHKTVKSEVFSPKLEATSPENTNLRPKEEVLSPKSEDCSPKAENVSPKAERPSPEAPRDESSSSRSSSALKASLERLVQAQVMKMSDTWNEDSPNSVSFPSLSGSGVLASSQEDDRVIISRSMEGLLELEATKVAMAIAEETSSESLLDKAAMEASFTSESLLEMARPPAAMVGSLSASLSEEAMRKVPTVVRRALNGAEHNGHNGYGCSMDYMSLSSCNSHLENVKPPPAMDEIDMENSMISVASITSEVAGEVRGSSGDSDLVFNMLRPVAAMAELYARSGDHSLSENIDNVGPPSTFNEITDITEAESTMEPGTETMGSDTELEPDDLPADPTTSNDSTPKKRRTPKQRRQILKDRYATYTIADDTSRRPDASHLQLALNENPPESRNPKQRRLEERERFLTQTLETPGSTPVTMTPAKEPEARNIKTARQRRVEDKERYLTQTITSPILPSPVAAGPSPVSMELGEEELEALQREASMVAHALEPASESTEMLDCETLSLISNDSEQKEEEAAGPRIVKPGEEREASPKGIRGRRKPLYSSSVRSSRVAAPVTKTPPAVRPTRASALRQRGASPRSTARQTAPSSSSGGSPKNKKSAVKPVGKLAPKPPHNSPENTEVSAPPKLVKQGTFTKDSTIDPAVRKSRLPVRSPSADTITSAPGFRTSSEEGRVKAINRLRRDTVQPAPKSVKPPVRNTAVKPRSPLSFRRATGIKPSLSNHSLQQPETSASKAKTSSTPSLNTGTKKKEVTSRIASLWKKVEDSQYKQKFQKDTRVWITNGTDSPQDKPAVPPKTGLAATFARMARDEEKKPQASAVVQPFNYSPPTTVQPVNGKQTEEGTASVRVTSV